MPAPAGMPAIVLPPAPPWAERGPQAASSLPGIRFEVAPSPPDVLPRMDVPVFVGFAASGPLDTPVPVEDAAQFSDMFGADLPLAWDAERGEPVWAYLGPTVRTFFANGGLRCWIVRVARDARPNVFPIAGLAEVRFDLASGQARGMRPAYAVARSVGSWSDGVRVSAGLVRHRLQVVRYAPADSELDLLVSAPGEVVPGDLLRLSFGDSRIVLLAIVASVDQVPTSAVNAYQALPGWRERGGSRHAIARVAMASLVWLTTELSPASPPHVTRARVYHNRSRVDRFEVIEGPALLEDGRTMAVCIAAAPSAAPSAGSLMRIDVGDEQVWLSVSAAFAASPPREAGVWLMGEGFRWLRHAAPTPPHFAPTDVVEKLTLELWARTESTALLHLADLGLTPEHPRFWGALPTDEALFQRAAGAVPSYAELWADAASPRFPVAGAARRSALYIPVGMPPGPGLELGPVSQTRTALERDGLANFDAQLFLDPQLLDVRSMDLLREADFVRYQSPSARRLRGIYATLGVEEASFVAVPDATHRGWTPAAPQAPPDPVTGAPDEDVDRVFHACNQEQLSAPTLRIVSGPSAQGTFTLAWTAVVGASFRMEEARTADFVDAVGVYAGADTETTLFGHSPGDYYYRVRAENAQLTSNWSEGVVVHVPSAPTWSLRATPDFQPEALVAVHRALLRLCEARGDQMAVLSVPEHYRESDTQAHITALSSPVNTPRLIDLVAPLGGGEARAFGFGALYHPWLLMGGDDSSDRARHLPPDGPICGMIARRAIERGAWIAPANAALSGVVALSHPVKREYWLSLQAAQINVIRQEARGFMPLSSDTLSVEADLRPINVRRLLILLRRLALREGARYVFEPNDDTLRRTIQRGFTSVLSSLFERGAFAGATAETAFRVDVAAANSASDMDQGRFIVELRVAPALPLVFLVIRLLHTPERGLVVEEG